MVGAGAVVVRSVPPLAIVVGNPARIVGYVDAAGATAERDDALAPSLVAPVTQEGATGVRGVQLHRLTVARDMRGSLAVAEFALDTPALGLHLPPLVWGIQYKYTPDALLAVFASDPYDPDDYIRDYDEFLRAARDAAK